MVHNTAVRTITRSTRHDHISPILHNLDFIHIRIHKFYTTTDVHTLFGKVDIAKISEYLKELGLYDKI